MTSLVACLLTGKGSWAQVAQLMRAASWEKVFLVTNAFGKERFTHELPFETILLPEPFVLESAVHAVVDGLKGKVLDTEVAVNLVSGSGLEHMAVLAGVLRSGLGVRLVMPDEKGFQSL